MIVTNFKEIANRGGSIDNAEFSIVKCSECGEYALYDEEICFIYRDPHDLTEKVLYGLNISGEVPCLGCGAVNSFDKTSEKDIAIVLGSPWRFVFEG